MLGVLPGVEQVMVHQSFEWAADCVPVAGGQQGLNLGPHQLHLVLLDPDDLELPSAATRITKHRSNIM